MVAMTEEEILKTIGKLADALNVEVYAVGGFVRDKFMDIRVKDIDFVVVGDGPAFANKVASTLGVKNIVIFERFQTAMIQSDEYKLEFVGARSESYAENSRKPIVKSSDLQSDLMRRDFTINAIALGLNAEHFGKIIDPFDGRKDIVNKIIRTPLNPEITFKDDPLRILRAIRFATRLHFQIEPPVLEALKTMRQRLEIVSQERITEELLQIMKSEEPSVGFYLMDEAEILPVIFPEISALKGVEQRDDYHHKDVFIHTLKVVDNVAKVSDKLELRIAALLHDIAKPRTKKFIDGIGWTFHGHDEIGARMLKPIFEKLRLPKDKLKYTEKLVRLHLRPIHLSQEDVTDSAIRRLLFQAGEDIDDLLILCRADITSGNPDRVQQHLANFEVVTKRLQEVEEKDQMKTFQSPVKGDEIMKLFQIPASPMVGKLKKMIEEAILDDKIDNDHDAAFQYLMKIKDQMSDE